MPNFTLASFSRYRDGKLSAPSTITSYPAMMSMMFSADKRVS